MIISSQFVARIRRGFFTLGDGCWLRTLCDFEANPKNIAIAIFLAAGERARLRPPWSLRFCDASFQASHHGAFLCEKNYAISSFLSLEFWCSEGTFGSIRPNFRPPFRPTPTCFKPSCRADLTYFHLFRPILPGGPDLLSPIWT